MVLASPSALTSLFDGTLKVLVASPTAAGQLGQLGFEDLRSIVVSRVDPTGGFFLVPSGKAKETEGVPLSAFPTRVFCALAANDREQESMTAFLQACRDAGLEPPELPVLRIGGRKTEATITALLAKSLNAALSRVADLSSAVAVVRQEHQQTRRILFRMQDLLWGVRNEKPQISVVTSVGRRTLDPDQLLGSGRDALIEQRLLAPAAGVAGFDLHIAEVPEGAGALAVRLVAADDYTVLGRWVAKYADIRTGWLHFPLPIVLADARPYVNIELEARSFAGTPPILSLAAEEFLAPADVRWAGEQIRGSTLAMRVWSGFPGTRNTNVTDGASIIAATDLVEYALPQSLTNTAERVVEYEASFTYMKVWGNGEVFLHPLLGKEVSAVIRRALPPGTFRVEAVVSINDNSVNDVEFALCAAPAGGKPTNKPADDSSWLATSGWIPVRSRKTRERFAMPMPDGASAKPLDLYLFTRVPNNASVDYAQAVFHRLEVAVKLQRAQWEPTAAEQLRDEPKQLVASVGALAGQPLAIATQDTVPPSMTRLPSAANVKESTPAYSDAGTTSPATDQITVLQMDSLEAAQQLVLVDVPFQPMLAVGSNRIVVHPLQGRVFAVSVPLPKPGLYRRIEASLGLGHKYEGSVQFRIALLNEPLQPSTVSIDGKLEALPGSDWFELHASEVIRDITVTFEPPVFIQKICLMTRVPNNLSVDYAAAYFERIVLWSLKDQEDKISYFKEDNKNQEYNKSRH